MSLIGPKYVTRIVRSICMRVGTMRWVNRSKAHPGVGGTPLHGDLWGEHHGDVTGVDHHHAVVGQRVAVVLLGSMSGTTLRTTRSKYS